ncbi:MAG: acetyl-CoA acetyltransferase [Chloroflexi bacterium HGW-Chloroflexi-6]|nr:MAG: acetyl-CoA acetyltransferase [Chloroflexi bacterium HGW-Chloroflexi-6]
MTEVIIAGIGQTAINEHWDKSLRQLGVAAIRAAIADSGGLKPQALFVGNMFAPNLSRQAHLGGLLADFAGLRGIEAATVEAAGASGGAALRQGYLAVKSGMVDVALVVGLEKMTDVVGSENELALATTSDSDFEAVQGLTAAGQAALLMRRYMYEYHVPADGLAGFAVAAHAHGAGNPQAMFQKAIKPETYSKAEMVSDPLNMFDIAPSADGAAALILTRRELLPKDFSHPLVAIAGSAISTDMLALHDRHDLLTFESVQISTAKALRQAEITLEQVGFFEYHDAFSIFAALSLESTGFAPRGQGWKMAADGALGLKGKLPCATMGGLKAGGNSGGAAGVVQAVEAARQLRGSAGANQLSGIRYGMIQSLGGPASTAVTHILKKMGQL